MTGNVMTGWRATELIAEHSEEICSASLCANPVVSVGVIAFNHGKYIEQALSSVLSQETHFPIEIVIGDDHSQDGTTDIVLEFQRKDPHRIRVLVARENLGRYTGNGRLNLVRVLRACRGKYIALLDGDDYWTCKDKLQMQVDALNSHPEWAMCFHRTSIVDETGRRPAWNAPGNDAKPTYSLVDILSENFIQTASTMYRNDLFSELPEWFFDFKVGDWPLHVLNAQHGEIGFLEQTMAVYRLHEKSSFSSMDDAARWRDTLSTFELFEKHLGQSHASALEQARRALFDRACRHMSRLHEQNRALKQEMEMRSHSYAYRVARALTTPARSLRRAIRSRSHRSGDSDRH